MNQCPSFTSASFSRSRPDLEHSPLFAKTISFWKDHILLANASHAAGGFGLAVLLQRYLAGRPAAMALGWFLLAFALAMHLIAFI